ncbi:uncharacterized protein LOC113203683 [Frankliniella occidentalis]|uniref:Uncharacterized protein LOC113203683 n=1 Tax=Frankliniella occidentalis TaxID=133901 RepID=A0A9C6X5R9_FRAOC|nr:uncharacterized protein LOC113203683 [Frankliniella occidentalis]
MPACAALCLALWIAAPAAPAGGAPEAPGAAATAAAAVPSASPLTGLPTSGESLLQRRWRLDSPLPTLWGPSGAGAGAGPPEPRGESDEELGGRQHYPARRSLHWLPSGLGTNWDLRGENAHPVRHPKSHHGRHHGQHAPHPTAGAPAASSSASEAFTPTTSAATSSTRTAINRTLGRVEFNSLVKCLSDMPVPIYSYNGRIREWSPWTALNLYWHVTLGY